MEDALKRLDSLIDEESRMAITQTLKATRNVVKRGGSNTMVAVDNRVAGVDDRVVKVDDRVAGVDSTVTYVDDRVASVDGKVKMVDNKVAEAIHGA